jgi:hypothetical protein
MSRVVAAAMEHLDLEKLGSGPGESLGFGPDHEARSAHEQVVRALAGFPGMGWPLVQAGLRSPVIRIRHAAVATLKEWGREAWPPGVGEALERASAEEPRDELREAMRALL